MPGAASTILAAFQAQGEHRRAQEAKIIDANIKEIRQGQLFALVSTIAALIAAVACAAFGQPLPAAIIGGGTIATLVLTFIKGRRP